MRLIDADALREECENHYEVRNAKQNATMDEVCMMIDRQPTVSSCEEDIFEIPEFPKIVGIVGTIDLNTVKKTAKTVPLAKLNHEFFMRFTDEYTAWDIVYAIEDMINAKTAK